MESISMMIRSADNPTELKSIHSIERRNRVYPHSLHPIHNKPMSPHAIDPKSQKTSLKKYLMQAPKNKKKRSQMSEPQRSLQITSQQRNGVRYNTVTPSTPVRNENKLKRSEPKFEAYGEKYTKVQKEDEATENQKQEHEKLPYLKSRKSLSPQQQLTEMGYSSDTRLISQLYSNKVQQRKIRYVNKVEALKKQLERGGAYSGSIEGHVDARKGRRQKCSIQVKLLDEQIRRGRERELMRVEQRKGKKMLEDLLKSSE